MKSSKREREIRARKYRPRPTGLETIDAEWRAYHRYIFQVCADRLSPSDDLAQFAVAVAEPAELCGLVERILDRQASLKLPADTVAELESVTQDSLSRLRDVCVRAVRNTDTVHAIIIDHIGEEAHALCVNIVAAYTMRERVDGTQ